VSDVLQGETISSDSVSSLDFSSLHEQAMSFGNTPEPVAPAAEQVAEPPAPVAAETQETQTETPVAQPSLAQLKDDDLVEVLVDGQPTTMSWKDAKAGVMRQADYTRKTQSFAQERNTFNAEREALARAATERETLVNFLNSPEAVAQFVQSKYPQLFQGAQQAAENIAAGEGDAQDIATVGQLQNLVSHLNQQLESVRNELNTRDEKVIQRIQDAGVTARLATDINATVKELFTAHPYIDKVVPNAEDVLRWNVLQMQPGTPEETVQAVRTVFGGWVENFQAQVAEATKTQAVAKQKLVTNNIQPAGGIPPAPTPTAPTVKNGQVDWKQLNAMAMSMLGSK
jgi:hypothetical protein